MVGGMIFNIPSLMPVPYGCRLLVGSSITAICAVIKFPFIGIRGYSFIQK
jgi:hypothetical protein